MYRHDLAYRHENGTVEGFTGFGFTTTSAEEDCTRQMRIKCELIRGFGPNKFAQEKIIRDESAVTPEEMELIRQDWASGARYTPEGAIVRDRGPGTSGIAPKPPKRFRLCNGDPGPGGLHHGFCRKCTTPLTGVQYYQDLEHQDSAGRREGCPSPACYCLQCSHTLFGLPL